MERGKENITGCDLLTPNKSNDRIGIWKVLSKLNCGLFSGLVQAAVFNPWDRALYLSVMHHRPFLKMENFRNPMAGVMQTIAQRAISGGLYFPLEDIFLELISRKCNQNNSLAFLRHYTHFTAGLLAGSINGLLINPLSSVKVCRYSEFVKCAYSYMFNRASHFLCVFCIVVLLLG
jgi:hypothetical protein